MDGSKTRGIDAVYCLGGKSLIKFNEADVLKFQTRKLRALGMGRSDRYHYSRANSGYRVAEELNAEGADRDHGLL
jgi:hypothetical protein